MKLSEFDYELPPELIAQEPLTERDASRLLHLLPDGSLAHRAFKDLPRLVVPGDLLVVNETRVFPARLRARRPGGGMAELLLLEQLDDHRFRVLAKPARRLRLGTVLSMGSGSLECEVVAEEPDGRRVVRFDRPWTPAFDELGTTPLPPYIRSEADEATTRRRYQTVYASERGSIAAPTAGLHFTKTVFSELEARDVGVATLTLHVGYATFEPIRVDDVREHRMGTERFRIPPETVDRIERTHTLGHHVVAVGTTTVRALESAFRQEFPSGWSETDLFITPGFEFHVVDGLLTNFHLPKSSLLLLVAALGGVDLVRRAYDAAVCERYRFYSYGDAMLVHPARNGATVSV